MTHTEMFLSYTLSLSFHGAKVRLLHGITKLFMLILTERMLRNVSRYRFKPFPCVLEDFLITGEEVIVFKKKTSQRGLFEAVRYIHTEILTFPYRTARITKTRLKGSVEKKKNISIEKNIFIPYA